MRLRCAAFKASGVDHPIEPMACMRWLNGEVAPEQIVLRCNDFTGFLPAVRAGMGAAPLNCWQGAADADLYPLLPPPEPWLAPLWLVTHRDLHRSPKVQALSQFLKRSFKNKQAKMLDEPP